MEYVDEYDEEVECVLIGYYSYVVLVVCKGIIVFFQFLGLLGYEDCRKQCKVVGDDLFYWVRMFNQVDCWQDYVNDCDGKQGLDCYDCKVVNGVEVMFGCIVL